MTKFFMALFAALTALALWATAVDFGVTQAQPVTRSVRDGSAGNRRPQGK